VASDATVDDELLCWAACDDVGAFHPAACPAACPAIVVPAKLAGFCCCPKLVEDETMSVVAIVGLLLLLLLLARGIVVGDAPADDDAGAVEVLIPAIKLVVAPDNCGEPDDVMVVERRSAASAVTVVDNPTVVPAGLRLLDEATPVAKDDGGPAADADALVTSGMAAAVIGPPKIVDCLIAATEVVVGKAPPDVLEVPADDCGATTAAAAEDVSDAIDESVDVAAAAAAGRVVLTAALDGSDGVENGREVIADGTVAGLLTLGFAEDAAAAALALPGADVCMLPKVALDVYTAEPPDAAVLAGICGELVDAIVVTLICSAVLVDGLIC
jgi:hypothetical protein